MGNFLCNGWQVPLASPSSTSVILLQKVEWVSESPNQSNTGPSLGPGFSFNERREEAFTPEALPKPACVLIYKI